MGERDRRTGYLVLGTAQLGQAYGVANRTGTPSETDAVALVRKALDAGICHIDTARAYGDSERRIGLAISETPAGCPEVTTKLDPLSQIGPDAPSEIAAAAAGRSLEASRAALGRDRLDAVLLHRAFHRTAWGGAVWSVLRHEREAGRIGRIGVSVQTPEEAHSAIADPDTEQIQMPFNLLDHRWADAGVIIALRRRSDIVVHVRSVFLQGLLVGGERVEHWSVPGDIQVEALVRRLARLTERFGLKGPADLCLSFARAQDWIDGIVVGMETQAQLDENLACFKRFALSADETTEIVTMLPRVADRILDPAQWPRRSP